MSHDCRRFSRRPCGFSLIEVLVAILVLAVGLLGYALLQTMTVRLTQSSNQRTQATNLACDMLDQMRANRMAAPQYTGAYDGSDEHCEPGKEVSPAAYRAQWQCRLQRALGSGASARVTYVSGQVTVSITWNDQRWTPGQSDKTFIVESRL